MRQEGLPNDGHFTVRFETFLTREDVQIESASDRLARVSRQIPGHAPVGRRELLNESSGDVENFDRALWRSRGPGRDLVHGAVLRQHLAKDRAQN